MIHETISLTVPGADGAAELITYAPDNFPELGANRLRPALIICPGGGYHFLTDREGEPVALRFAGLGCAAFLLKYHVAPRARWPVPQRQLLSAVAYVRDHWQRYHIDPHAVVVMGFSAGGHLAGSAGLMWNKQEIYRPLRRRPAVFRPDGAVLCYPVVTSGPAAHRGSMENLLGERYEELLELVSLERRVTRQAPPFFIWHTVDDTCVPVENSLLLDKALRARGVESELHIYPHGSHGQSLADHTVFAPGQDWAVSAPCSMWVTHCAAWLHRHFGDYALAPHPDEAPKKKRK
ncbi:MAG: alpha/beta hydrolase [Oscillospiraceae bacterium]|nr:alpha/beta hydrolase [Oscillospiraceae bacterium]